MNSADLIEKRAIEQSRESFWSYRQFMNPKMKRGWFQRRVAHELQSFHDDLVSGLRPKLVIQSPPQHGKTETIVDFISWAVGHNPDLRTIYASFSDRLGVRANLRLQRMFDSQKYSKIFPETRINQSNSVTLSNQFLRNREIIEFVNHHGYFRNTTVRGSITGETIDLGIIDDPIKGRAEANSQTVRDSSWDWLTDDFLTRFSDDAGLLCILTRWHIDDPIGRLIARKFGVKVLSFPAIATEDDEYRKTGDALFPELKPIDFLLERKAVMNPANFESLYQQNPVPPTGGTFKREWFKYWTVLPCFDDVVISVDCSFKKKEESSFVAIEVWGIRGPDSYFIDMTRERMGYVQTREAIRQMAYSYAGYSAILIEDKANGPAIIDDLSEELRGIIPIEPDGSKEARAESASTDYNAGNVFFPDPSIKLWTKDVVEEHACFPNFPTNDTVDAATQFIRWRRKHGGGVIIAD